MLQQNFGIFPLDWTENLSFYVERINSRFYFILFYLSTCPLKQKNWVGLNFLPNIYLENFNRILEVPVV